MKVLIPVDGSECSKNTLEWACKTLDKNNTEFYILHVIPRGIPELVTEEFQVEDALKIINGAEAFVRGQGGKVAKYEYMEGDPIKAICDYADSEAVDQVLMGSHGRTGLSKILLGSISTGVMEQCRKPVFIYKNIACREGAKV